MPNAFYRITCNRWAPAAAAACLAIAIIGLLSVIVSRQRGNLAWDDADYLRRALANTRVAESAGRVMAIPRALGCLLHEHPKPPWLVAWIQLGAIVLDRHRLGGLILHASVVPYALLLAAVVLIGKRLAGAWGGVLALVCLVSSPYSLAFGGKVMVETFLSLWVLIIFALTCRLLERPSRPRGMLLGIVVGLALMTKLTTILFIPIPLAFALAAVVRRRSDRLVLVKALAWSVLACGAVATPWYALNAGRAIKFAQFSAKYNLIAEGRSDHVAVGQRLILMTADLPGWPLVVTMTCAGLYGVVADKRRRQGQQPFPGGSSPGHDAHPFAIMAWLGAGTAMVILLFPTYFDARFLLPIWPVLAVDLGGRLAARFRRFPLIPATALAAGLMVGVVSAASTVASTPTITTYWNTAGLIDGLVRDYQIHTLGNVGCCAEWNVCKTGLINELRDQPASCFVLHDLTKLRSDDAVRHLAQFDAIVVLGREHLPESRLKEAPGLNRSYGTIAEVLAKDPTFSRVAQPRSDGLPEISVYIHQRFRDRTEQLSRKQGRKRRS